jgi:hypothetical protein
MAEACPWRVSGDDRMVNGCQYREFIALAKLTFKASVELVDHRLKASTTQGVSSWFTSQRLSRSAGVSTASVAH